MIMMDKYNTMKFSEVYSDSDVFSDEFNASPFAKYTISDSNLELIFALLYARYGNSPIANLDVNQWKYKLFSYIFQYAPSWIKALEIQDTLRNLTEDEILTGTKAIYNHAYNDGTAPGTGTLEELDYLNEQNTSLNKKSKLAGYAELWSVLANDVTEQFITRFKKLFSVVVAPQHGFRVISDVEDEEEE